MVYSIKDADDLDTKLAEAGENTLVVIDFYATWCGPCKMITPKLDELQELFPDVVFVKVDVEECEELATEYEISSMPSFIFIKNKQQIDSFAGANYDKLKETIARLK